MSIIVVILSKSNLFKQVRNNKCFFFFHTYERNISFRCSTLKFDELIKQLTNYHNRSRSNFHESRQIPFPRVTKPAYCPVNTHRVMSNHKIRLTFMHCPHPLMFSPVRTTFTTYSCRIMIDESMNLSSCIWTWES